jgi:hypothetical protein
MKYLVIIVSLGLMLTACSKDNTAADNNNGNGVFTGTLKYSGTFSGRSGYTANGQAKIYGSNTADTLLFDNFSSSGGPDLKVYLSKADTPTDFITLGALKATSGVQTYIIPANTNFTVYKYVLIHCQQFNKLFAVAELRP